jgi:hypothetical protein
MGANTPGPDISQRAKAATKILFNKGFCNRSQDETLTGFIKCGGLISVY